MALLADSSYYIAHLFSSDENYNRAGELVKEIESETILLTDHVLDEILTFVIKHKGNKAGFEVGKRLLNSENIELIISSENDIKSTLELLKGFEGLSFTDTLSVHIMKKEKIKRILSFDSDFDRITGIERLY